MQENEDHEKLKASYEEAKSSLDTLKEKLTEVEAKLHSSELIVQMSRNTKSSTAISRLTHLEEDTKDLQMKLSIAEKDIVSLKIQLEDSRGHAKQYRTIADTMEKALQEASETNENTKKILEEKIAKLTESNAKLEVDFEEMSVNKQSLETTLTAERQSFEDQLQTVKYQNSICKKNLVQYLL